MFKTTENKMADKLKKFTSTIIPQVEEIVEPDSVHPMQSARRSKLMNLSLEEKKQRQREQQKKWLAEHPDYNKTYREKYYQENREKILAKRRQKRAEEKKLLEEYKLAKKEKIIEAV